LIATGSPAEAVWVALAACFGLYVIALWVASNWGD
jgi:hypothetical protein